ncbi:MAG: hypothetical protein C0507_08010 [Cyanobacteria bacterium PR.3.49]|nr:hypothetical protein [Cyanobacteria bacterium PR.3.49]
MAKTRILQDRRRAGRKKTRTRGNTLVLIVAVMAILIAILLFALGYTRLVGSSQEQKTAIEAASLAAAKEISRIVINDPNFGFISLSDAAPVGKSTTAGDNYFMPVFGINTLMGTIRLDLIIAESMNNNTMKTLAKRDLTNLKLAKETLIAELKQSLINSGASKDADGQPVNPYTAAEQAYLQNQVRLTGGSSYVAGSMKLSLGCLEGPIQTNIPIPKPSSYSHVSGNQSRNECYMSGVNIPFAGEDFVFAAVTDSLKLVDPRKFTDTAAGLPYQMPSIVKAEADQKIQDPERKTTSVVHAVSCAAPASVYDPKPAPGSLTFSFPDGTPPELTNINSILVLSGLNGNTTILQKSTGGDYPEPGSSLSPMGGSTLDGGALLATGIYDWLKRAGARLDAEKAVDMLTENFSNSGVPSIHIFSVKANGTIQYNSSISIEQNPYWPASENQLYGQSQDALTSSDGFTYDMHVRDYTYQPGTINGGKHGGEPLTNPVVVVPIVTEDSREVGAGKMEIAMSGNEGTMVGGDCGGSGDGATSWVWIGSPPPGPPTKVTINGVSYKIWPNASSPILGRNDFGLLDPARTIVSMSSGPGGGLMRPTYLQNGAAVDVRFRQAIDLTPVGTPKKVYVNKKGDLID